MTFRFEPDPGDERLALGLSASTFETRPPGAPGFLSAASVEALYRSNAARLLRYFGRRGAYGDAADLLHETFAKIAAATGVRNMPVERPDAYLTTVAKNVLRDRARAAARRALEFHHLDELADGAASDPHRVAESREGLRAIERALSVMNPRRRRIFMLHRFDDLTYSEIGEAVGMSEKGVKKQMAKALVELRAAVERAA